MEHGESESPRSSATDDPLGAFLVETGLRDPARSVAALLADPRTLTRREVAQEAGLSRSRIDLAAAELRLSFLSPRQGQLPVRILHEAIAWAGNGHSARPYALPQQRRETETPWHASLSYLHRCFTALQLSPAECEFAELLVDPDMLNEKAIAEILGISANQAAVLRQLLRVRTGAQRRGQVRLLLLHAALREATAGDPPVNPPWEARAHGEGG